MSKPKKKTKVGFWIETAKLRRLENAASGEGYETLSSWVRKACIEKAERFEKSHAYAAAGQR